MRSVRNMRKSVIRVIPLLLLISGCTVREASRIDLANNDQQKEQAFHQIMTNQELYYEFMDRMTENRETMHWMMDNQQYMDRLFSAENLDYIRNHHRGMTRHMMQYMTNTVSRDSVLSHDYEQMHREMMYRQNE